MSSNKSIFNIFASPLKLETWKKQCGVGILKTGKKEKKRGQKINKKTQAQARDKETFPLTNLFLIFLLLL